MNSCGLSLEYTKSNSRFVKLVFSEKPDSVLALFKDHGFTNDQITSVIKSVPRIISLSPENVISPKLMFFNSIEFSTFDTAKQISLCPKMLSFSLKKRLISCYGSLKSILVEKENVVKIRKIGFSAMFCSSSETLTTSHIGCGGGGGGGAVGGGGVDNVYVANFKLNESKFPCFSHV